MITVPTHKRQNSKMSLQSLSKTIYVFTSGQVIVTVQILSRNHLFKGLKMTTAHGPSTPGRATNRVCAILLEDLMKRGVCQCGGGGDDITMSTCPVYLNASPQEGVGIGQGVGCRYRSKCRYRSRCRCRSEGMLYRV
jgi:hypothetical protein